MLNAAANRDPRQFDDPLEFKLDRANGRQHIGFGHGIHSCAGAPLARAETKITIERFLALTDDIRISEAHHGPADARRYEYDPTYMLRGLRELHLEFTPAEAARDGDLQPHRAGRHRPRAVEALLPGGVRLPVLVRDPAARRGDVEAQLPRAAARDHRVVPRPRRLRARAHGLRRGGRGRTRTSRAR